MATDQEKIEQLERENEELRAKVPAAGGEGEPLTLAEIRAMSREEVEQHWDRVKQVIAPAEPSKVPTTDDGVHGASRIARAYGNQAAAEQAGESE